MIAVWYSLPEETREEITAWVRDTAVGLWRGTRRAAARTALGIWVWLAGKEPGA